MRYSRFTRSTPVGCLFGFFWLALLIVDALGFVIWYRAAHELLSNLVDELSNQAAAWSVFSPSLKTTPWMTSGSSL